MKVLADEAVDPLVGAPGRRLPGSARRRTNPINGVTYIVSGAGSRTSGTGTEDFTAVAYSTHHNVDLNIYPDHILLRAIDQDGEQFDEAVIPATLPAPPEAAS